MDTAEKSWLELLKRYFGFTSFRPLQREIIGDTLAGKDVFALLPTGGGKSLCFLQINVIARMPAILSSLPIASWSEPASNSGWKAFACCGSAGKAASDGARAFTGEL